MHCNLSPPDVTPVVLGLNYGNYEAHDASAYKFNTSLPQPLHAKP